jgi:hypothetical protein
MPLQRLVQPNSESFSRTFPMSFLVIPLFNLAVCLKSPHPLPVHETKRDDDWPLVDILSLDFVVDYWTLLLLLCEVQLTISMRVCWWFHATISHSSFSSLTSLSLSSSSSISTKLLVRVLNRLTDDVILLFHEVSEVGTVNFIIEYQLKLVLWADVIYYTFLLTPVLWSRKQRIDW